MELINAQKFAIDLMQKHGLIEKGWRFSFDKATSRLGVCNHTYKKISISRVMTLAADEEVVTQTIIHEVAHALTPPHLNPRTGKRDSHGAAWKAKARELGYTGKRTAHNPSIKATNQKVRLRTGQVGYLVKEARVNYHVLVGKTIHTVPFESVTFLDNDAPLNEVKITPEIQKFSKGDRIRTAPGHGKYSDVVGVIKNVGSKNYSVTVDGWSDNTYLRVPHSWAIPA